MAWLNYQRLVDGSGASGKFGESIRVTERWQIRVDSPDTSKADIVDGVTAHIGITWGTSHPECPNLKAMEFELAPAGREGMIWLLTVTYYAPPPGKTPQTSGIPKDVWSAVGGTTTVPVFADKDGAMIVNSASDPLEGLEREREERTWSLTKHYATDMAMASDVAACAGKVNSAAWANGAEKTWKCYFRSAKRVTATKLDNTDNTDQLHYIEAQWEFRYDPLTWKLMPWDVGFMEIVSGQKKAILTSDGKPVKQPVALNSNGSAKSAGSAPSVIKNGDGVDIYETANFFTTFGNPQIMPA